VQRQQLAAQRWPATLCEAFHAQRIAAIVSRVIRQDPCYTASYCLHSTTCYCAILQLCDHFPCGVWCIQLDSKVRAAGIRHPRSVSDLFQWPAYASWPHIFDRVCCWRAFIRASTMPGSAKVDVSPSWSNSPEAILRRMRRMILPLRVFGSPGAQWMTSGAANAPIASRTPLHASLICILYITGAHRLGMLSGSALHQLCWEWPQHTGWQSDLHATAQHPAHASRRSPPRVQDDEPCAACSLSAQQLRREGA
jgi:hypothetical protein